MISTLVELLGNFYANNDFTNFEAVSRGLLAAIPNDTVSLQFLGLVYYRTGRINDAIRLFDKVVPTLKNPAEKPRVDSPVDGDSAVAECYQEATRQSHDLAQAWYDLGLALVDLNKHEQAIPAFRSALTARPVFPQAMLAIGQAALRVDDLATAEAGFSHLRVQQPNNAEAYLGLGRVSRQRRDFSTARGYYRCARMLRENGANRSV